jgi:hypothetical protein
MQRLQEITTRPQSWGRAAALAAALLILAVAPAQAVSIYLEGCNPTCSYGFVQNDAWNPAPPGPSIGVGDFLPPDGGQVPFMVSSAFDKVISFPGSPDSSDPFILDFVWTVKNTSLTDPWFNAHFVIHSALGFEYEGYNGPPDGLGFDSAGDPLSPINIPLIPFQGNGSDLLAAVDLGYIPAGGEASFIIRYNIAGTIEEQGGKLLIPSIGTTVFANAVPEPSAGLLLGLGCAMIGAFSRQRRT